jgi:hypothetical protein
MHVTENGVVVAPYSAIVLSMALSLIGHSVQMPEDTNAECAPLVLQPQPTSRATRSVKGTVIAVSRQSLEITSGSQKRHFVFTLNADTVRDGLIEPGATVSVRYRVDGQTLVATAVTGGHTSRPGPLNNDFRAMLTAG